jgi:UDP-N-acetylmuramate dehydrogenase
MPSNSLWLQALERLADQDPSLTVHPNAPLRDYTRFALGGPALALVECAEAALLPATLRILRTSNLPWITIGGGSNLIVADDGFPGLVLRFTGNRITRGADVTVAESGAVWQDIVDFHVAEALAGMEKMTGIPGWFGGALYGNAGAYGQTIMDFVEHVTVFDGVLTRDIPRAECGFAYRTSGFKQKKDWLLLSASMRLAKGDAAQIESTAAEILATRNAKFPPTMKCAGSIFKNVTASTISEQTLARVPKDLIRTNRIPSAWFLEQIGSKGLRRGDIEVAPYHANLIYNRGSGRAADVVALIDELNGRVQREFNFALEPEVQFIGFPDRVCY